MLKIILFLSTFLTCCAFNRGISSVIRTRLNSYDFFRPSSPGSKTVAYQLAADSPAPCIILVSPELDKNVGSVARTMLNFGLHELRVVNPQCDITSKAAFGLASGAHSILENAKVYPDLVSCIADLRTVMATTVRPRDSNYRIVTPTKAADKITSVVGHKVTECGIIFGRESDGLYNEELSLVDTIITIPTFKHFGSLNLAQSVNIMCYELWKHRSQLSNSSQPEDFFHVRTSEELATQEHLQIFLHRIEKYLDMAGYGKWQPVDQSRRVNILNILRRIQLTASEVHLLHGVLTVFDRFSKSQGDSWWHRSQRNFSKWWSSIWYRRNSSFDVPR